MCLLQILPRATLEGEEEDEPEPEAAVSSTADEAASSVSQPPLTATCVFGLRSSSSAFLCAILGQASPSRQGIKILMHCMCCCLDYCTSIVVGKYRASLWSAQHCSAMLFSHVLHRCHGGMQNGAQEAKRAAGSLFGRAKRTAQVCPRLPLCGSPPCTTVL